MDNGYHDWLEFKQVQNKKRIRLFAKLFLGVLIISLFVFFFGYENPKDNITEFFGGFVSLLLLSLVLPFLIYKIPEYIPICNKCGRKIRSVKEDCIIGNIEELGTVDKTVYENVKSTIKGKTVFPRGGYSTRNSTYEHTSESNYEMNSSIPLVKCFHVYNVEYCCKMCREPFCKVKEESLEPLERKL